MKASKAGFFTILLLSFVSGVANASETWDASHFDISEFLTGSQIHWSPSFSSLVNLKGVDQDLIEVTSDADSGKAQIKLEVGENLEALSLVHLANGVEKKRIPFASLASGYELVKSGNITVLKITSKGFSPQAGGVVDLVYLTNGITGSYNTFQMDIVRAGDQWLVQTVDPTPKPFTSMYLEAERFFGKPIGIKHIIVK